MLVSLEYSVVERAEVRLELAGVGQGDWGVSEDEVEASDLRFVSGEPG